MSDTIIPQFTTHVVCTKVTPLLKQSLNALSARSVELANKLNRLQSDSYAGNIIVGYGHNMKLVTI
jgi:hypothetical protein